MRLLIASDIHLEFSSVWDRYEYELPALPPEDSYDAVLLAGDIGVGTEAITWANDFFPKDKPIYYTPGNHEFYRSRYEFLKYKMASLAQAIPRVDTLAPGTVELGDRHVLIAATLWSDLKLNGYEDKPDLFFERSIADFSLIATNDDLFSAEKCRDIYEHERQFIIDEVVKAKAANKIPVVMTHFVPTDEANIIFKGDPLSPYFVNDCDDIMKEHEIPTWIFGHSHIRVDFKHSEAGTRIVSNAFGYPGELGDPAWKIIEV